MANEIVLIEGRIPGSVRLLFYYPIPAGTRIQVGSSGTNVVATPAASLPPIGGLDHDHADYPLSTSEKTALDDGEAVFAVAEIGAPEGMSAAALLAAAQAKYADVQSRALARYGRYEPISNQNTGKRFNAT